jgi:outer membrane protein
MRKWAIVVIPLALALVSGVAQAELKVGFVNIPKLFETAPQMVKAQKEFEREFSPRSKKLAAEVQDIKQIEERLNKDSGVMSDSERQKLEKEIINRKRKAQQAKDEFLEDLNIRRREEMGKLQREIVEAIQSLAKEENYDLMLTDGVIHASEQIDATEKVQKKLQAGGGK